MPIPGAFEAMDRLRAEGRKLALVTNKPTPAIAEILGHFAIADRFVAVIGAEAGHAPKPAPDMLQAAMHMAGVDAAHAVMVGDGAADVGGARAAGVPVIVLAGGYGPEKTEGGDAEIAGMDQLADTIISLERDAPSQ